MASSSPAAPRQLSTQTYLFALVAAVVVPLLAFSAFLFARYAATERTRFEEEAARIARQVSLVVDGELIGLIAMLRGLAASTSLDSGDLAQFHAEAKRLAAGQDETILLRELGPVQLLNTERPFGAPLPPAIPIPAADQAVLTAGRSLVWDVYRSPISGAPRAALALPIFRQDAPVRILAVTVPTSRIRDVMLPAVPEGWIVGVGDRNGTYVTRSARHDDISGTPGLPEYRAKASGRSGTFTAVNFEGTLLLAGYYRSDFSDWLYAANIPLAAVERPLWQSLAALAALGAGALALSAILAVLFGKRFTSASTALAQRAAALGEGRSYAPVPTRLAEFAVVDEALSAAAQAVEERGHEREKALEREALLASIFEAAGLCVCILESRQAECLVLVGNRGAAAVFGGRERRIDGLRLEQLGFTAGEVRFWVEVCDRSTRNEPTTAEYRITRGNVEIGWYLTTSTLLSETHDGRRRTAIAAIDITERKRGEEQNRLLMNELNHRVKNTLATVQSIAVQTLRGAESVPQASEALTERLMALAQAHDLLTRESWEGAELREVAVAAVRPHVALERCRIEGPPVWLPPSKSLSLALVLHELATNAAKYGALSQEAGFVMLSWQITEGAGTPRLVIRWSEHGGPLVRSPTRTGFGSRLIQRTASSEIGGSAIIDYAPTGVQCVIELPLARDVVSLDKTAAE